MTLRDWINKEGVPNLAKKLGVNESAVRHWRANRNLPKDEQKIAIRKLSKGLVTYEEMIETHFKARG